jgi:hypothetical protein
VVMSRGGTAIKRCSCVENATTPTMRMSMPPRTFFSGFFPDPTVPDSKLMALYAKSDGLVMSELRPLIRTCACGSRAAAVMAVGTPVWHYEIPLCDACHSVLSIRLESLPTHEPSSLKRAASFPPGQGEWFRGEGLVIGCPACPSMADMDLRVFSVSDSGRLKPSFICPSCGLHLYLVLEEWEVE